MPIYGVRRRVACYVTRTTQTGEELLVFEHADDDPDDPSGIQIPAGGMLPFEGIEEAAVREVNEETGLEEIAYVDQLGGVELGLDAPGGPSMTTYVHLTAASDGPSSWEHIVSGDGEDAGLTFVWRWEPLPLRIELVGGQDAFLDAALA